jgi:hypothetical protein
MPRAALVIVATLVAGLTACARAGPTSGDGTASSPGQHDTVTATCPDFTHPRRVGQIDDPRLTELSGLAASRRNRNVLWVHNDSGAGATVYAVRTDGALLATLHLAGAEATDWEDIAVGPGPVEGTSYLYVGDVGDNDEVRPEVTVWRVVEPAVDATAVPVEDTLTDVERIDLVYPDVPHNAEALLVDSRTADVLTVTKTVRDITQVFVAPGPVHEGRTTLRRVGPAPDVPSEIGTMHQVTGGDVSPDGRRVVLRTYGGAFVWERSAGQSIGDALGDPPCPGPVGFETQGEAIGWTADGSGYLTASEGSRPPILRVDG